MQTFKTLLKKETTHYYQTKIGLLNAIIESYIINLSIHYPTFNTLVNKIENMLLNIPYMLLFMIPLLTMRLYIEEKNNTTITLLLSFPIHEYEIILSKSF